MRKLVSFFFILNCFILRAQTPKLMLPIGHTSSVRHAEFSPNGKLIVSASWDKTAKIWDVEKGIMLMNLTGHRNSLDFATFSPDGNKIITCSWDSTAKIWDANTGNLLFNLQHSEWVISATFSPDGKKIITVSRDAVIKLWDTESGKLLKQFNKPYSEVSFCGFCPIGTNILLLLKHKSLTILDERNGKEILSIKNKNSKILSASYSRDGNKIFTISSDSIARILDAANGKLINSNKLNGDLSSACFSANGDKVLIVNINTLQIRDVSSGRVSLTLENNHLLKSAHFSVDGNRIVTYTNDYKVFLWDAQSGKLISYFKEHKERINSVKFNNDASKIVTASDDKTLKIWDAVDGKYLITCQGHCSSFSAWYSPKGSKIFTARIHSNYNVFDARSGKYLPDYNDYFSNFNNLKYSQDEKNMLATIKDTLYTWKDEEGKIALDLKIYFHHLTGAEFNPSGLRILIFTQDTTYIINASTGSVLFGFEGSDLPIECKFSPDGSRVAINFSESVGLWDATNGKRLADLRHSDNISVSQFSPDGKKIMTASWDGTLKIWDARDGKLLTTLKGHKGWIISAKYSPDGTKIVSGSSDHTIKIWDGNLGIVKTINESDWIDQVLFSPDGSKILSITDNGITKVWDISTETLYKELKESKDVVISAEFSPDGKNIMLSSLDNTCKIWNAETGKLIYTFIIVESNDYLFFDNQSRYDGTEAARKLLYFTCGTEVIGLDQVKDQLWVPNLVERIMKGDSINAPKLSDLDICGLTPEVEEGEGNTDEYYFKIIPHRGGLGETVVYVNGIEAKRYKSDELKKSGTFYELVLKKTELSSFFSDGKENKVTVKAYTSDNTISSRGAIIIGQKSNAPSSPPNLYAVMVGVSDYKGEELDLKYAAKDATDLSSAISNAAKKLLNTDGNEHVFMYNLTTETTRYQLPEKNSIKKVLEEIGKKATANDILLIFFAGHGVMEGQSKQFYFLTADASGFANAADVGISTAELTEWMKPQNIKAQKRILILDACNSGQAIKDFVKMGDDNQNYLAARNDDKSQQIKAIDKLNEKSGLFILSASASNQSAYEMGRYSQGLLTYSLLKAIKQDPTILEDGKYLNVSRWFNAAEKTVTELSKENGARQEPQIVTNTNFNIGLVDEDVIAKIVLPTEKPLFASSNFQNADENIADDDLELSKLINLQLNDIASRGANSKLVYVMSTNSPDAYSLIGRYTVKGNKITVTINVKQNKAVKTKFELTGTKDKLTELSATIAEKAAEIVKK